MALHISVETTAPRANSVVIPHADIVADIVAADDEVVHLVAPWLNHGHRHLLNWPLLCHDEGIQTEILKISDILLHQLLLLLRQTFHRDFFLRHVGLNITNWVNSDIQFNWSHRACQFMLAPKNRLDDGDSSCAMLGIFMITNKSASVQILL
jgi:hypothetical protein